MLSALIISLLASAAPAADRPITVTGHAWAPFISPMGEPFRARTKSDDTLALWFRQADKNQDGTLTPAEMQADAERFFATLDTNDDGQIDPEELVAYEWEVAPEIQVNSRWRRARGQTVAEPQAVADGDRQRRRDEDAVDGYLTHGLQGAARYALLNIPEPVAAADADLDRAVTLGEFRRAAGYRFQLLDTKRQGKLTLQELEALVPVRPEKRRARDRKDALDSRVGLPLPRSD